MKILIFFCFTLFFAFNESALAGASFNRFMNQKNQRNARPTTTRQQPTSQASQTAASPPSPQASRPGTTSSQRTVPLVSPGIQPTKLSDPEFSSYRPLPPRSSQFFYTDRLDSLTTNQRQELDKRHLAALCGTKFGEKKSCGYREQWSHMGDPHFTWDPYMNQIKPGTPIDVEIKCDVKSKRFFTNVSLNHCTEKTGKKSCKKKYFSNPYAQCRVKKNGFEACGKDYVSQRPLLSDRPQNWLTSPGIYLEKMKTNLPSTISRTEGGNDKVKLVAQDQRIAGSGVLYEGARVPNLIWLNKNGNAIHGSQYVDGRPRSQGCLRLHQTNAMALYRLARRVGTKNFKVKWGGYGPKQSDGRPACAQSDKWNKDRALHYANHFIENGKNVQAAQELKEEILNLAGSEGRTPVQRTPPPPRETEDYREEDAFGTDSTS